MKNAAWGKRSALSRSAHVVERIGLALAGGSCGLFVAAHIAVVHFDHFASVGMISAVMLYGAVGFYLGIDLPQKVPDKEPMVLDTRGTMEEAVELLSAAGTFVAATAAAVSVYMIGFDDVSRASITLLVGVGWTVGATMQIAAGIIARVRQHRATS